MPLDDPSPKKHSEPLMPSSSSEIVDESQLADRSSLNVYRVGEHEHDAGWARSWGRSAVARSSKDFILLLYSIRRDYRFDAS